MTAPQPVLTDPGSPVGTVTGVIDQTKDRKKGHPVSELASSPSSTARLTSAIEEVA
jgi:hypothetical protein